HHAETGILSRKSELRELRQVVVAIDQRIGATEQDLTDLRDRLAALENQDASQQEAIEVLAEQAADLLGRLERHRDKRKGLDEEVTVSRDEIRRIATEIDTLDGSRRQAEAEA